MGDDKPQDAAQHRPGGEKKKDEEALVERLRAELDAARARVGEAWERYQRQAHDRGMPAIAASPLLPALLTLVQQA
jgi:hypothetical protein